MANIAVFVKRIASRYEAFVFRQIGGLSERKDSGYLELLMNCCVEKRERSVTDQIVWINHAGYELRTNGVRIVHDPWTEGSAFADGWALVSPTKYTVDDFSGVDYIWFSHEHPDHFAPAVLRKIPAAVRAEITVLYKKTRDQRVVEFCRKLGFCVVELENGVPLEIKGGVKLTCGHVLGDSWLCTQTAEHTYLNANDVVGVDWKTIAATLGVQVDVLFTQFSYANWLGNPGNPHQMIEAAENKRAEMDGQIAAFKPDTLIPFASYVWFCREENFHLNAGANRIDAIYQRYAPVINTVVLYPGDCYEVMTAHDSAAAVERYSADWAGHNMPTAPPAAVVPLEEIIALSSQQQKRLRQANWMWMLAPFKALNFFTPINIWLTDIAAGVKYSVFGGVLSDQIGRKDCDIEIGSAGFSTILTNGYGYGTYAVNGCFYESRGDTWNRLSRHFAIPAQNEQGFFVPGIFLRADYILPKIRELVTRFRR
jgi:UDP-MurNAc hydroxylase